MKKILMVALVAMLTTGLYAQNTLFAVKKGMVLTYRDSDAQGKTSGYSVMTIKDVKGSGRNMSITYGMLMLDNNRKTPKDSPGEQTFTVDVKDDVVFFDMNQFIPAQMRQQGVKVEISGIPMELPNNLQAGQRLKDATVTMRMDLGIMKMDTVVKMTDGRCLAIENVTVPAGTFRCHKITQTITSTAVGTNTVTRTVSWYAPAVGTVKTETYDNRDRLSSSSVLAELAQR
jgi:hypothetical protein